MGADNDAPERDRPFDGWRVPASAKARELVAEAVRRIDNYERHFGLRKRARKARDQASFEAAVASIVADLVHHHLEQPGDGAIAIPLDKRKLARRSRYRPVALNDTLPHLLRVMAAPELSILEMVLGAFGRQTTIKAGHWLRARIASTDLGFGDVGRDTAEEVIILRGTKRPRKGGILRADLIEYADDALTVHLREDMRAINAWLAQADLALSGGSFAHIDTGDRRLRRVFNNATFTHGGRFGGGWWTNLPKDVRREHVRIGRQRVATLDFDALFPRLCYARVRIEPPKGDPYGYIRGHRRGAKVLFNSLLFDDGKPRTRKPKGTLELLPKGVPVAELIAAIERTHAPIALLFGEGVGFELMNLESAILVRVLLRLRDLGVVGLPVHDALIVARSAARAAAKVMTTTAEEIVGCRLPVTIDDATAEDDDDLEDALFTDNLLL